MISVPGSILTSLSELNCRPKKLSSRTVVLYGGFGFTRTTEGGKRARPDVTKRRFPLYGPVPPLVICTVSERFNCTGISDSLPESVANPAHGLDWDIDIASRTSDRIVDLRHVEVRDDAIIVPTIVSKSAPSVASKEHEVEVGDVDRRFVSDGKALVRCDESNGGVRSCYVEKGRIQELDEWR